MEMGRILVLVFSIIVTLPISHLKSIGSAADDGLRLPLENGPEPEQRYVEAGESVMMGEDILILNNDDIRDGETMTNDDDMSVELRQEDDNSWDSILRLLRRQRMTNFVTNTRKLAKETTTVKPLDSASNHRHRIVKRDPPEWETQLYG
ncbi:uncharacterized protein [Argopecten irradians]|uniref:uncharacterized protein n=1 Tax=Argopecten irradians TaxID=31199 RepID=UPI0037195E72